MKYRLIGLALVIAALAGCASPERFQPEGPDGLAEPVMEASVAATRAPAPGAGPVIRPRARPAWVERCGAGDDGIGGTGCPVD